MIPHTNEAVNAALVKLNDALCTWERDTGIETALIVRSAGWEQRSLSGKPAADDLHDLDILECVDV